MLTTANTWTRFINLDQSEDRRRCTEEVLKVVEPVIGPARRFSAIKHKEGWKGCTLSHLAVLQDAIDNAPPEVKHLAVFEDDIIWRPGTDVVATLEKPINSAFDVLMLAYTPWMPELHNWQVLSRDSHLMRLTGGELAWSTGYVVHRRFWSTLHSHWTSTLDVEPLDISWRALFPKHQFLCFTPQLGNQAPGQSTINADSRMNPRHADPNIAFVGRTPPPPLGRLFPMARSVAEAKRVFDFVIYLGETSPPPLLINQTIHLCKRRWFHNNNRCCYDLSKTFPECQIWGK